MSSSPQQSEGREPEQPEPVQPLNRAERRAQRRGRRVTLPAAAGTRVPYAAPPAQVVVPRRAGRRGNR